MQRETIIVIVRFITNIVVNETFTRFYSDEEYIYKIEKIIELPFSHDPIIIN